MAKNLLLVVVLELISLSVQECIQKTPCLCEINEFSKIDISQVLSSQNKSDYLHDYKEPLAFYFFGCRDGEFNQTAHGVNSTNPIVKGSLIIQDTNSVNKTVTVLGTASQIKFSSVADDNNHYQLLYHDSNGNVSASVYLLCDEIKEAFIKVEKNDFSVQKLILSSPHACMITINRGLSTGSVLIILFCVSIGIYFFGGALILYFIRGARGIELIPNIDFWKGLPGLVKDGTIFLLSGLNANSINTPDSYDRI